jgi:pimeloyl-ACP methyl ester carboxylesterase
MTLAHRDEGRGEAIVFVHGFPLDGRMWDGERAAFAATHRVIVPDLRGFGRSSASPFPTSLDEHADDLAALLDSLGIARATMVGLSMGGYITLAFARRHRDRLTRIGLSSTRATADSAEAKEGRDRSIDTVRRDGPGAIATAMRPKLFPHGAAPPRASRH